MIAPGRRIRRAALALALLFIATAGLTFSASKIFPSVLKTVNTTGSSRALDHRSDHADAGVAVAAALPRQRLPRCATAGSGNHRLDLTYQDETGIVTFTLVATTNCTAGNSATGTRTFRVLSATALQYSTTYTTTGRGRLGSPSSGSTEPCGSSCSSAWWSPAS